MIKKYKKGKKTKDPLKFFFFFLPWLSPLSYLFLIFAFVRWLRKISIKKMFNPRLSFFNLSLFLLIGTIIVSVIFSIDFNLSLKTFFVFFSYVVVLTITRGYAKEGVSEKNLNSILKAILAGTAVVTGFGIIQYLLNLNFEVKIPLLSFGIYTKKGGISSTFGNPNRFAKYLVLTFPFILVFLEKNKKERPILITLLFATAFCFWLTKCLGGIGAAGVIFLIFVMRRNFKLGTFLLGAGVFLFLVKFDFLLSIINTYGTVDERVYTWENIIWPMFKNHPFFGTGLGTYRIASSSFSSKLALHSHAHNLYFNYLIEIGIFGLGSLILLIGSFLKGCLEKLKKTDPETKLIIEGCFLAIVGALIHATVETFIDYFQVGLLFFAIIGFGIGLMEKQEKILPTTR